MAGKKLEVGDALAAGCGGELVILIILGNCTTLGTQLYDTVTAKIVLFNEPTRCVLCILLVQVQKSLVNARASECIQI